MSDPKDGEGRADDEGASRLEKDEDAPRVSRIRVGGEDIIVLSVPLPELQYPEGTTAAERQIIDLVLQGLTVKEIASAPSASGGHNLHGPEAHCGRVGHELSVHMPELDQRIGYATALILMLLSATTPLWIVRRAGLLGR